jgi:hypothetical protein
VTFLLDANVLLDFQNSGLLPSLAHASQALDMAVAEKVFDEVTSPKPDDPRDTVGKKRQADAALRHARIAKIEILPGTREAVLMQALLAPLRAVREKDQGEAASIAIAAGDPSLLFVTGDKTAVLWALNELFHTDDHGGEPAQPDEAEPSTRFFWISNSASVRTPFLRSFSSRSSLSITSFFSLERSAATRLPRSSACS